MFSAIESSFYDDCAAEEAFSQFTIAFIVMKVLVLAGYVGYIMGLAGFASVQPDEEAAMGAENLRYGAVCGIRMLVLPVVTLLLVALIILMTAHSAASSASHLNMTGVNFQSFDSLSGGQQQRVAIARAVVCEPKLILADEPTGNLDSRNGYEVMQLLTKLNEEGTTVVMVTHSQRDANFAQRIMNLLDGQVVEQTEL